MFAHAARLFEAALSATVASSATASASPAFAALATMPAVVRPVVFAATFSLDVVRHRDTGFHFTTFF